MFIYVQIPKYFGPRLRGQGMHLVGGASLYPFVSYFSKYEITHPSSLPRSFFCLGRRYR